MPSARLGADLAARVAAAWPNILDRIASGETIAGACKAHGLEPIHARAWRGADPVRLAEWEDARRASADSFADEVLETARNRELDSAYARVLTDSLKWAAAKRNPDHYADRSKHDINVKTIDYTGILQRAEARLAARVAGQVIEGQVIRPELAVLEDDDANPLF